MCHPVIPNDRCALRVYYFMGLARESSAMFQIFVVNLRRLASVIAVALGLSSTAFLGGCDFIAQTELKPGISTKEEVLQRMGKPEMIWEEKDGSSKYEYPRGPEGHETYMVSIAPDGRYLGMENILVDSTFAKVKAGMTRDELRRLLGRPTETVIFKLKQEEVWTWRHKGVHYKSRRFHVMMDLNGVVKGTDATDDPRETGGG
jgi:hypothetical protein